jgi:hypothetical protein
MTPPPTLTHFTIPFAIPAYWPPEQALAVVELLDDLRELIWAHYGMQVIDEVREQHMPEDGGPENRGPQNRASSNDAAF